MENPHVFAGMCGSTEVMRTLFQNIERVAHSDATVLVTGESGTGKDLVARAIHDRSARSRQPFIALNCSALPAELVESELFGHVRGSFTGASHDHDGLFRAAHGGTLLLDEIGDLAINTQAKVLRVLENGEILRVGSTQVMHVDARVVAATNRSLEEMVQSGGFREDLFYRLKVVALRVPPLRERPCDVPELVAHFLRKMCERDGVQRVVEDDAMQLLQLYQWPGNVRELRNTLAGAAVMARSLDRISAMDLPEHLQTIPTLEPEGMAEDELDTEIDAQSLSVTFAKARAQALHDFDRFFLAAALRKNHGNIARTARSLGMHRQSLQKIMAKRGIKAARLAD